MLLSDFIKTEFGALPWCLSVLSMFCFLKEVVGFHVYVSIQLIFWNHRGSQLIQYERWELTDRKDPGTLFSKILMLSSVALDLKVLGFVAFMTNNFNNLKF